MNLQQIMRVVLCAALVALCVAGAGLFSTQPVAGQEAQPTTLQGAAALERLKQDGQYESLQAALKQARFHVSRVERTPLGRTAWHAPNPAAGYDAFITETGVSIALNEQSYVSLSLQRLGYGAALQPVAPGTVSGDRQTINIAREGVQEWYINGPDGLEHGFTLAEPPGAPQQGVPLRLALQVSAGWRAMASEDGQQVRLRSAGGQVVEYSKLVVRDRRERHIPARLTVADEQVVIEVEDSAAAYPLTIDPLFSLQQKLQAADGASWDYFGNAVALSGDTLVVGAFGDTIDAQSQGSVYVFKYDDATWIQQQKLFASDGAADDGFGAAVALSGNTLVVGAWREEIGVHDQGAVYVFTRNGTVWTQQQKLFASNGALNDGFGSAVTISGNTLAVGAYQERIGTSGAQGSAYIFTRNGGVWTLQQNITANDGAAYDWFGSAVALSGDRLVVGASGDTIGSNAYQGSAYIFTRSGTTWTQQEKLFASDGARDDAFGVAVALSGDTVVVGAHRNKIGANYAQGAVYVYTYNGTYWSLQRKLFASNGAKFDYFGAAVALSGDTLVVGAYGDTLGGDTFSSFDKGSAYVFTRTGAIWTQRQKLFASDAVSKDSFGISVALSDGTMAVGVPGREFDPYQDQGAVHVFYRPPCSMTLAPASLPNGFSGRPYQQSLTVSGGVGPYQIVRSSGALPPGLALTSAGLLSGTPTTLGTYQFTLSVTDLGSHCSTSRAYTLTITTCPTLTLDPPDIPDGALGMEYSHTLAALGGREPYRFVAKGKLPPGLSLSADGVFSGTPTQMGYFPFTLLIIDANGCGSGWASSMTITEGGSASSVAPRRGR